MSSRVINLLEIFIKSVVVLPVATLTLSLSRLRAKGRQIHTLMQQRQQAFVAVVVVVVS